MRLNFKRIGKSIDSGSDLPKRSKQTAGKHRGIGTHKILSGPVRQVYYARWAQKRENNGARFAFLGLGGKEKKIKRKKK